MKTKLILLCLIFPLLCPGPLRGDGELIALAKEQQEAVLKIDLQTESDGVMHGFGVFVSADGLALVDLAMLADGRKPTISSADGTPLRFGTVLGIFAEQELVLMKFKYRPRRWLRLAATPPEAGGSAALLIPVGGDESAGEVPPIVGSVTAKPGAGGSDDAGPKPALVMVPEAELSPQQKAMAGPMSFAIRADGEVIGFFKEMEQTGSQMRFSLLSVAGLGERIDGLAEAGEVIDFPFPASSYRVDLVGESGALEKILFEGVEAFESDAIRKGLLTGGEYMAASHPRADRKRFETMLVDSIVRGYRDKGFADVEVGLKRDPTSDQLTVVVEEGMLYRKSDILIRGVDAAVVAEIIRRLTTEEEQADEQSAYFQRIRNHFTVAAGSLVSGGEVPVAKQEGGDGDEEKTEAEEVEEEGKGDGWKVVTDLQFNETLFGYPLELTDAARKSGGSLAAGGNLGSTSSSEIPREVWDKGEAFSFGNSSESVWRQALTTVLSDMGYGSADIELRLDRDSEAGLVDLVVRLSNLGKEGILGATLGTIQVEGAKINSEQETLDYLGLKPGLPLTAALLEDAELKLIESARYLAHRFVVRPRAIASTYDQPIDLLLQVREYPGAPPLKEPLPAISQALVNVASWFSHLPDGDEDLVFEWESYVSEPSEDPSEEPVEFPAGNLILSPGHGLLLMIGETGGGGSGNDQDFVAIEFSDQAIGVYTVSGSSRRRWQSKPMQGQINFKVSVTSTGNLPSEGPPMDMQFFAGVGTGSGDSSESPVAIDLFVVPVMGVHEGLRDGASTVFEPEPGVLQVGQPDQFFLVEKASGRLVEGVFALGEESAISMRSGVGAFERRRDELIQLTAGADNEYNENAPMASFFKMVVDQVLNSQMVQDGYDEKELRLARSLIDALLSEELFGLVEEPLQALLGSFSGTYDSSSFWIPAGANEARKALLTNQLATSFAMMLEPAGTLFPEDSWLRTLAREIIYVSAGNREHLPEVMGELQTGPNPIGPLGYFVASQYLDRIKSPVANLVAEKALGALSTEDFFRDLRPMITTDLPISDGLIGLFEAFVETYSAEDPGNANAKIARQAIELHRSGEREAAARQLEPLFADIWENDGKPALTAYFENRLGLSNIDRNEVAVVVNGEPITHLEIAQAVVLGDVVVSDGVNPRDREKEAMQTSIFVKLMYLEFLRRGGTVPRENIAAAVENVLRGLGNGDRQKGIQQFEQIGIAESELISRYERNFAVAYMSQLLRQPTEPVMRRYYDDHPEEFASPREVELSMISRPVSEENRGIMKALRDKLLDGADFALMAETYSEDFMADKGGAWGWVGKGKIDEKILKHAFDLDPGNVSAVFEQGGNYRLLKVSNRREAKPQSFLQAKAAIAAKLAATDGDRYLAEQVEELRRNAAVIPIEDDDPWSFWGPAAKIEALARTRGQAFEEVASAIEGKLIDGERRFRIRMVAKTGPVDFSLWALDQEQEAYEQQQTAMKNRGLEEIHHQQFVDEDGKTRHQTVWRKGK
jgi:parvulin-like peptidyl-prolyl isomerase